MSPRIELLGGPDDGRVIEVNLISGVYYTQVRGQPVRAEATETTAPVPMVNVYRKLPHPQAIRNGRILHRFEGVQRA